MVGKKAVTTQTFFYILMSIMFIWIVYFGITNIFNLQTDMTQQELIFVSQTIETALTYCDDPLNRGSRRIFEFRSELFNSFCHIGQVENPALPSEINRTLSLFRDTNNNVVLFDVNYVGSGQVIAVNVINSLDIFLLNTGMDFCYLPFEDGSTYENGVLYVEVEC